MVCTASLQRLPATWTWPSTPWTDRCARCSWRAVSTSESQTFHHLCSWTYITTIPSSHHYFHHQCSEYHVKIMLSLPSHIPKYPNYQTCVCLQYVFLCVWSGGYNLQDVVFYWTRGNDSVKGLDTLRLAQYSVESYYTTASEAVYETGRIL